MNHENLCIRLEIVADQLQCDGHKPMAATVQEAIGELKKSPPCLYCENWHYACGLPQNQINECVAGGCQIYYVEKKSKQKFMEVKQWF